MLGWIYFIASCYIVTTIAKLIYKSINLFIKSVIKLIFRKPNKDSPDDLEEEEVENNVC